MFTWQEINNYSQMGTNEVGMNLVKSCPETKMTKRKSWKRLGFSCLPNKGFNPIHIESELIKIALDSQEVDTSAIDPFEILDKDSISVLNTVNMESVYSKRNVAI
jgi:hypothetical protein